MKYDEPAQITLPLGVKVIMEEQAERKGMDVKAYLMSLCHIEKDSEEDIKFRIHLIKSKLPQANLTLENFSEHHNIYYIGLDEKKEKQLNADLTLHLIRQYLKTTAAIVGILFLLLLLGARLWEIMS